MLGEQNYPDHRTHLENRLRAASRTNNVVDEIITNEKLDQIYQKISTVCEGNVVEINVFQLSIRLETIS